MSLLMYASAWRAALLAADEDPGAPVSIELPAQLQPLAIAEPSAGYAVALKRAVFVTGLEYGIPFDQPNARVLAELNLGRDAFLRDVPHPLVIWLPDYAVTAVARYAPDFWAWRSGVFEFETGESDRRVAFEQSIWRDQPSHTLTSLTPEARLLRRRQLESLLDDYRDLSGNELIARERARVLGNLGDVCSASQDFHTAIAYFEHTLRIQRQTGDRRDEANTLIHLGSVYTEQGDQQTALEFYEEALSIFRQVRDQRGETTALNGLARAYASLGDQCQGLKYYEQILPTLIPGWRLDGENITLDQLGTNVADVSSALVRLRRANEYFSQALACSEQALPILRQTQNIHGVAIAQYNIARLSYAIGEAAQALTHLESQIQDILETLAQDFHDGVTQRRLVEGHDDKVSVLQKPDKMDDHADYKRVALEHYKAAASNFRAVDDRRGEAAALNGIGLVHDTMGEKHQALDFYEQALWLQRQVGDRGGEATTLNNIGGVHSALGDKRKALDFYEQALPLQRQVGDRWGESITRYNMGMVYEDMGDLARAEEELKIVVELETAIEHPDLASDRAVLERVWAKRAEHEVAK